MKIALVGSPPEKAKSNLMIFKEMQAQIPNALYAKWGGIRLYVDSSGFKVLYKGVNLCEYDVVYPRIGGENALFGYNLVYMLHKSGVYTPIKPKAVRISHDKFLTLVVLSEHGLPVPKTYLVKWSESLSKVFEDVGFPAVLKLLSGAGGKGVMLASDEKEAKAIADLLNWFDQPVFIEEFIPNPGEDIRLFVIGNEVVAAMKRKAKRDFRANIASGGVGERYFPTEEEKELAIKAAEAIGAEIAGIDIIHGPEGPIIIETNISPGIKGITKATGKNIAKYIVDFLVSKAKA